MSSSSTRPDQKRPLLVPRASSPTIMHTFNPDNILPDEPYETHPQGIDEKLDSPVRPGSQPMFGAAPARMSASGRSVSPPSVFDQAEEPQMEQYTEPTTALGSGSADEPASYDLKPPPPSFSQDNVEALSQRLWSTDHLDTILFDQNQAGRFTKFLNQYRPNSVPNLTRYLETRKAISAIQYANALAEQMPAPSGHPPYHAAHMDDRFEAKSKRISEDLVEEALPAYVTHRLVGMVTDTLVKEVTGNGAPVLRELIPSLAEVYCVTDPSLPDNPIVYASDEFYNTSQYGREYVIGRNCRFLQGPKTSNATVKRMIEALTTGQEICETILNYRRDGSPFMNLLMIAPLYDNKGTVRYFLGCQIDVSSLIEGGRGLESFSQLLAKDRTESRFGSRMEKDAKRALGDLGSMFTEEEAGLVKTRERSQSRDQGSLRTQGRSGPHGRRILGMDEPASERTMWPHPSLGPSGRLPGVYQNYLLVRPYPSLRITFTSPALRIPGLLQTKFLDRIGGPQNVREGIVDALAHGQGVTAKISWLTNSASQSQQQQGEQRASASFEGKPRWIHCTPLLGSDEQVGVWMVVMVENEEVTGTLNRRTSDAQQAGGQQQAGAADKRFTGNKLYAEYLRREGGGSATGSQRTQHTLPIRGSNDQFRDF